MQESEITSISEDFGREGINVDDVRQRGTKQKITFILTIDLPDCFNHFNVTQCKYIKPTPVKRMLERPWV
jgi:predicted amino acid-binding ACT domain protein